MAVKGTLFVCWGSFFDPENVGNEFLRKVGIFLPDYNA
jgi:hypothetical protein